MRWAGKSVSQSLTLTLLATVLLARFAASAHYHTVQESTAPHSCGLCAVAHHAPAVGTTPTVRIEIPVRPQDPAIFTATVLPVTWTPRFGRAPPFGSALKFDTAIASI
jgi:hypothetical protein